MDKIIPIHFEASFDSQRGLRPTSDPELFICRVRAFYKYSNRNGSYITDEFAKELAESAYLKPVFGRYLEEGADFLGHEGPREVKAYGFVLPDYESSGEAPASSGETFGFNKLMLDLIT